MQSVQMISAFTYPQVLENQLRSSYFNPLLNGGNCQYTRARYNCGLSGKEVGKEC